MSIAAGIRITPAELAAPAAMQHIIETHTNEEVTKYGVRRIAHLDTAAGMLDLIARPYWVEAGRGITVPVHYDVKDEVEIVNYAGFSFFGRLACYSRVEIDELLLFDQKIRNVDAVCLTFNDVTVFPLMSTIPQKHLLHVPVLAVNKMDQAAA